MILVYDQHFRYNISAGKQLQEAYNNTRSIATFKGNVTNYDLGRYPFTSMSANYEGSVVQIRSN